MRASIAVALPGRQEALDIELEEGSTVAQALRAARDFLEGFGIREMPSDVGIWGRPCALSTRLREGDRIEVYRPLKADPRRMRRERARLRPSTRSRNGP